MSTPSDWPETVTLDRASIRRLVADVAAGAAPAVRDAPSIASAERALAAILRAALRRAAGLDADAD